MVTINDFFFIRELLSSLAWYKTLDDDSKNKIIECLYELVRKAQGIERDIIFSLTKKLDNITFHSYNSILSNLISLVPQKLLDDAKQIYIIPVMAKKDFGKTKSGASVAYYLNTLLKQKIPSEKKVECLSDVSSLEKFADRKDALILFCDEFIGSGSQAVACMNWYSQFKINSDSVLFLTFAILQAGVDKLNNEGISVYYNTLHKRGISDDMALVSLNAIHIMQDFEARLQIPSRYQLGYNKSEALIAFNSKAPNNTFPIYWYKKMKDCKVGTVFQR